MKRFVRYWAIRLLGREWFSLSMRAKLISTWLILSFVLLAGAMDGVANDELPLWVILIMGGNLIITAVTTVRLQRAGEL